MAKKDDRENQGDDLIPQQRQFLLGLSSALQDRVPLPGIVFGRMIQSNDAISTIIFSYLFLTVSAPPETPRGGNNESEGYLRLAMYTTCLRRLQKPHFSQSFLPWTVEDRPRQEDAQ